MNDFLVAVGAVGIGFVLGLILVGLITLSAGMSPWG